MSKEQEINNQVGKLILAHTYEKHCLQVSNQSFICFYFFFKWCLRSYLILDYFPPQKYILPPLLPTLTHILVLQLSWEEGVHILAEVENYSNSYLWKSAIYKFSNSSILCLVFPLRICLSVLYLSRPALMFAWCNLSLVVSLAWSFILSSSWLRSYTR